MSLTPTPLLLTVQEAASALRLGRSTVYELIQRGDLEVVHIGRACRVPTDALARFVNERRPSNDAARSTPGQ